MTNTGCRALIALGYALALAAAGLLTGCDQVLNNPHPIGSEKSNTMFVPFVSRSPKYLDPTSSYSNDETPFTYEVYEPLYGYQYLKRPYEIIGRTAREVARPHYLDKNGADLAADAPGEAVAQTVYDIHIKPGILYAASGIRSRQQGKLRLPLVAARRRHRQAQDQRLCADRNA